MNILKISAWYLLFMSLLHIGIGLAMDYKALGDIVQGGVGTIDHPYHDRLAAFWFQFSGVLMCIVAGFCFWSIKRLGALPGFLGWACLGMGVIGGLAIPVSGFWLYLPAGLALIYGNLTGGSSKVAA